MKTLFVAPGDPAEGSLRTASVGGAIALLAGSWSCLAAGGSVAAHAGLGPDGAALVGFGAAALLTWRAGAPSWRALEPRVLVSCWLAGVFAFLPLWDLAVLAGLALGLAPMPLASAQLPGPGMALAVLLLAPLFEEHLYRGALLPALVPHVGRALALAGSSLLFALPHLEPWSVIGSFVAGLALGVLWLRTRSAALCAAAHAGLNSTALLLEAWRVWSPA